MFTSTPGSYTGPVPMVVHVHGAHVEEDSDGYAEAWYLPNAANIPSGFFTVGSMYDEFKAKAEGRYGQAWTPGSAVFQYPNDQRATTLWYHDHTLGMTRLNVYAGPAGFYNIRGGPDDLPAGVLPGPGPCVVTARDEILRNPARHPGPLLQRGRLAVLPGHREFFDGFAGPVYPGPATSPRSGTRRLSATRWSSTATPGRSSMSSRAGTASAF